MRLSSAFLICGAGRTDQRRSLYAAPSGEVVKQTLISVWLFGGLVPALGAINVFAYKRLTSPAQYDGFVKTDSDAPVLKLASLGAPDRVVEDQVATVLSVDPASFEYVSLGAALGQSSSSKSDEGPLYLTKGAFKKRYKKVGDATLDAIFDAWAKGSGFAEQSVVARAYARWKPSGGAVDYAAVDRDALFGRFTVLSGFIGLALIDITVISAALFAIGGALSNPDTTG